MPLSVFVFPAVSPPGSAPLTPARYQVEARPLTPNAPPSRGAFGFSVSALRPRILRGVLRLPHFVESVTRPLILSSLRPFEVPTDKLARIVLASRHPVGGFRVPFRGRYSLFNAARVLRRSAAASIGSPSLAAFLAGCPRFGRLQPIASVLRLVVASARASCARAAFGVIAAPASPLPLRPFGAALRLFGRGVNCLYCPSVTLATARVVADCHWGRAVVACIGSFPPVLSRFRAASVCGFVLLVRLARFVWRSLRFGFRFRPLRARLRCGV